jgi:hypothetical protein
MDPLVTTLRRNVLGEDVAHVPILGHITVVNNSKRETSSVNNLDDLNKPSDSTPPSPIAYAAAPAVSRNFPWR